MEEINLKDFWDYLKTYIILMVVIAVLLVSGTYIYDKILKIFRSYICFHFLLYLLNFLSPIEKCYIRVSLIAQQI